jgi:hypothetical protein
MVTLLKYGAEAIALYCVDGEGQGSAQQHKQQGDGQGKEKA